MRRLERKDYLNWLIKWGETLDKVFGEMNYDGIRKVNVLKMDAGTERKRI